MLIARVAGILLFTVIFGIWTLVPMGMQLFLMHFICHYCDLYRYHREIIMRLQVYIGLQ